MAQATGVSYSTVRTLWTPTSVLVVDVYTIPFITDGAPTPSFWSREWWPFENSATSSSGPVTLDPTDLPVRAPTPSSSSGMSNGAVAGISIATALVGGILGVIGGLLLARRGKRRSSVLEHVTYSDNATEPATNPATRNQLQQDQFLLGSTPDASLICDLRSLGHLIQQHAETHYHTNPVQLDSTQLHQSLRDLGIERGDISAIERLTSLALDPQTRLSAIRYVIAKAAFESVVIGGSTCISLLPPLISDLSLAVEDDLGRHEGIDFAIARWRQLTAFLLNPDRSQGTPLTPSEDTSTQDAQNLAVVLNRFLESFVSADREDRYEQENNLREVITECATFGYVLLSQPYEYRFRFEAEGGLNTIVVCPGIDRLIDEEGRRYQPPLPRIVAPIVESI
ncbi:hypothetical protein F5Y10DRAFT_270574 [Nemania abortiva]|nr:hypothetical protein F5Y10DRAFT_270574 [Nemania abortiva]